MTEEELAAYRKARMKLLMDQDDWIKKNMERIPRYLRLETFTYDKLVGLEEYGIAALDDGLWKLWKELQLEIVYTRALEIERLELAGLRKIDPQAIREREERVKKLELTPRDLAIISAVVAGYRNNEIAEYFKTSEYAVEHHLRSIFGKVGVSTRLELALFAVNQDLPLKPIG